MTDDSVETQQLRRSGILLHPTSLPGKFGIGDFGPAAFAWLDLLHGVGVKLWQILPLGQTGYGDSPYQCFSAFAGNRFLISPELLIEDGIAPVTETPDFPADRVDYGWVIDWKNDFLSRCADAFLLTNHAKVADYKAFCEAEADWLDDYALFMCLKDSHGGRSWLEWPDSYRLRDFSSLAAFQADHEIEISRQKVYQFWFFDQWTRVKTYANEHEIAILGDLPIFVSMDSADVWSNPQLFKLDSKRKPSVVAGVPPDYFSPTGQLWGNPLYDWQAHEKESYAWWIKRVKANLRLFDNIRLDHFRGFEAYWEVSSTESTAIKGKWQPGPGQSFFDALSKALGTLPIIAEDLGVITPEVEALRDANDLPGMKVLQFAFDQESDNPFLPHNFVRNCVAYTGTHDNDTTHSWFSQLDDELQAYILEYISGDPALPFSRALIILLWRSVADTAIIPLQDLLDLGGHARMNFPGQAGGNWSWRVTSDQLAEKSNWDWLKELNQLYGR